LEQPFLVVKKIFVEKGKGIDVEVLLIIKNLLHHVVSGHAEMLVPQQGIFAEGAFIRTTQAG
jgi:hypothetical protein